MGFWNNKKTITSTNITSSNDTTKIIIDGKTTIVGRSISINNNKIYVDGKLYTDNEQFKEGYVLGNITIQGNVQSINCSGDVVVNGTVNGNISTSGDVTVRGTHNGDINCAGDVIVKK